MNGEKLNLAFQLLIRNQHDYLFHRFVIGLNDRDNNGTEQRHPPHPIEHTTHETRPRKFFASQFPFLGDFHAGGRRVAAVAGAKPGRRVE